MSIVVGYDGSKYSEQALDFGVTEARLRGLPLQIVTTWDAPGVDMGMATGGVVNPGVADALRERAEQIEQAAAARLSQAGVEVTATAVPGPAAAALVELSADADLVVVGSHSRRGIADVLLGSTSQQVATHGHSPVIIVRAPQAEHHRIAVAVDGSQPGLRALDFAFDEANRRGWELRVIHAWNVNVIGFDVEDTTYPPGGILQEVREAEERLASEVLAGHSAQYPDVDVVVRVDRGHPDKVVLDNSSDVDLLVVGSRGHGGFTSLLLGSVSHKVMHNATCSVAVIR